MERSERCNVMEGGMKLAAETVLGRLCGDPGVFAAGCGRVRLAAQEALKNDGLIVLFVF